MYNYKDAAKTIIELDERSALHCAHIAEIFDVCRNGERYSHNAGDVVSSARAEILMHPVFREVPSYMAGWVRARGHDAATVRAAKAWAFSVEMANA